MLEDRIEARWIEAFKAVFERCGVAQGEHAVILSESQSRPLNVHLAEIALDMLGARLCHVVVPTHRQTAPVPLRSTGAATVLRGQTAALAAVKSASFVADLTLEGLMHARELGDILKSGTRVQVVSNEHPDCLERLVPEIGMKDQVKAAVKKCREASTMNVTSAAGSNLHVAMGGAVTAGVWGGTDRPGTLAHWPGGVVVSFPAENSTNGVLVLDAGDVNLTFKTYLQSPIRLTIKDDFVTDISGSGRDCEQLIRYLEAWEDRNAYAVSHVGWGVNPKARYEALSLYDKSDTNGTELRCFAGNFLFSTGANEFAGRFTEGHFDLPMLNCTIALDDEVVVDRGRVL